MCVGAFLANRVSAADNPDELYRQGRFKEAEAAYARSDMDNPKDTRYRYNRGCAAYQNSDYQGALAAFSSVLRRAKDNEMRFKATYNLGNVAFKQGDFQSAVAYYRQSILYNPVSEDAQHNLELALRELEKQEKDKTDAQKGPSQKDSDQKQEKGQGSEADKKGDGTDKKSEEKGPDQKSAQAQDQRDEKGQPDTGKGERPKEESPQDLSGELKALQPMPADKGEEKAPDQAGSALDRKKAEALLDNLKEDRSRFLRFRVPQEKKHGVPSGKDW